MTDSRRVAMTTPLFDATCCGGLSLVVCAVILVWGWIAPRGVDLYFYADPSWFLLTNLLFNWPHFMASYRLIYRDRPTVRQHPWVAIVIPAAWLLAIVWTSWTFLPTSSASEPFLLRALIPFAHLLLAWHYTGQAWGMTACFAHLGGLRMDDRERLLIRSGMRALFVYHVLTAWGSEILDPLMANEQAGRYLMQSMLGLTRVAAFLTFVAGIWAFRQLATREKRSIPLRCWLPWAAAYSWYVMVDRHPGTFLLLQAFHAIQYLMFPLRVEWNDFTQPDNSPRKRTIHVVIYYAVLVLLGLLVFDGPAVLMTFVESSLPLAGLITIAVNFHHYFIDSVIWKIRDPKVRQSLFGHLPG